MQQFIAKIVEDQGKERHVGSFEKIVVQASKKIDVKEMLVYANFVSYTEFLKGDVETILNDLIKFSQNF